MYKRQAEQFVGRAGGDEFIAVTHGMGNEEMKACLASVREQMAEDVYKRQEQDEELER